MRIRTFILALATGLASALITAPATAASVTVAIHEVNANGVDDPIGFVVFADTPRGMKILPNLKGLRPGLHGFHVHQNPDCGPAMKDGRSVPGLAAGGHYDPANRAKHLGPVGDGHLGDLPELIVNEDGTATRSSYAIRLKTKDLEGRSIVIHAGADNYADAPLPLGGGGARVACGVVVY